MKATFYARVSTDSDEQKNSIISQVDYFKKYIEQNKYDVIDEGVFFKRDGSFETTNGYYVDEGFSGAKSNKYRKAFQQMMKDARTRRFDIIFTKSISRFGRNTKELLAAIDELREYNIAVYFEDLKINTLDRADDFKLTIFAAQAQEESRSKSESVQFGKMQGYKRGIWGGREPYGFNIENGKLIKNGNEALVVKRVFDMYLNECLGLRSIAMKLNADKIPTKSGKALWGQDLISKILKNVIYKGEIRLHRTKKVDINQNLVKKIPADKHIVLQDENLRIIDDKTFELVQIEKQKRFKEFGDFKYTNIVTHDEDNKKIEKNVRSIIRGDTRHSSKHLFSNILKCGNCGGSLRKKIQNNKNRTFHYWLCRNNDQYGKERCRFRNLQYEDNLIDFVKSEIIKYKDNYELHDRDLQLLIYTNYNNEGAEEKVTQINETLEDLKADREANFKLYSRQRITDEEYEQRNERISIDIKDAESNLSRFLYMEDEINRLKIMHTQFIKSFEEINLDNLTNASLRKIISKVIVTTSGETFTERFQVRPFNPNEIIVEWNFITGITQHKVVSDYSDRLIANIESNENMG